MTDTGPTADRELHIEVRSEGPADIDGIRAVNRSAFARDAEADLVDALRANGRVVLSLVAHVGDRVVGHLLLSEAKLVSEDTAHRCLALAPMAVAPDVQSRRIGSRLVERALEMARADGHEVVVVLGHPSFYPRFGFEPARPRGIKCPFDAPDDAFMVVGLQPGALDSVSGVIEYAPEFADV